MWWTDDWGAWGWLLMSLTMLAFWVLVAGVAVVLVRSVTAGRDGGRVSGQDHDDPERIIDLRLARGEIDEQEHARTRAALRGRQTLGDRPPAGAPR
jgi:putative membrane protein